MTDSEALEIGRKLYKNIMIGDNNIVTRFDYFKYVGVANKALENQEKIKEVIENANQWSRDDVIVKAQAFCDIKKILGSDGE